MPISIKMLLEPCILRVCTLPLSSTSAVANLHIRSVTRVGTCFRSKLKPSRVLSRRVAGGETARVQCLQSFELWSTKQDSVTGVEFFYFFAVREQMRVNKKNRKQRSVTVQESYTKLCSELRQHRGAHTRSRVGPTPCTGEPICLTKRDSLTAP